MALWLWAWPTRGGRGLGWLLPPSTNPTEGCLGGVCGVAKGAWPIGRGRGLRVGGMALWLWAWLTCWGVAWSGSSPLSAPALTPMGGV